MKEGCFMPNSLGWPFSKGYAGYFEEGQQFGITSYYRPGGTYFHDGFDFGSAIYGQGSNILAIGSGEVIYTGVMGSGLGSVIVLSIPPYQVMYQEFSTTMADINVKTGDKVSKGQSIGRLNGSHLHLGITKEDWNSALGSWNVDNGTWLNPISIINNSNGSSNNTYDPKNMKTSQKGLDLIKRFEGVVLKAYQDSVGVWTIGYGHTKNVSPGMIITMAQANTFLAEDVAVHASGIGKYVTVPLTQNQFDALASFHFNLGVDILKGSDLLAYINSKQWEAAATEMKKYVHAGSQVLPGLVNRRNAEVALFLDFSGSNEIIIREGEIEMQCLYQVDGKGAVHYFDGQQVRPLTHADEMKVLQTIYKENNGKDMPFFGWTSSVPWHYRLKDILGRSKEF